jgi:hypothetical protein
MPFLRLTANVILPAVAGYTVSLIVLLPSGLAGQTGVQLSDPAFVMLTGAVTVLMAGIWRARSGRRDESDDAEMIDEMPRSARVTA